MPVDFRSNFILVPERRLCFIALEKCASTSAKTALRQALQEEGVPWPKTRERIVQAPASLDGYRGRLRHYYLAAIVRDPYDRIRSAYRNKIREESVELRTNQGQFRPDMSFRDFVRAAYSTSLHDLDRHLRPQVMRLKNDAGNLRRDLHVLRFERLSSDWKQFQASALERCGLVIPDLMRLNKSGDFPELDRETAGMIHRLYEPDFRLLRYQMRAFD